MSTLPKLQHLFKIPSQYNPANRTNQNYDQQTVVPYQQQQVGFPTLNSNKQRNVVAFNFEVQNIRELTLRKYESYVSQLRNLDRTFTLAMKKFDQNKTRGLARIGDNVSSIMSEVQQLKNQSLLLNRKLKNISKLQEQIGNDGVTNVLRPLQEGFKGFSDDFERVQRNVETLLSNMENRVGTCIQTYQSIFPITKDVVDVRSVLDDLVGDHNNTTDIFSATQEEIEQLLEEQRSRINSGIRERLLNITSRIQILEHSSGEALEQSQRVISDSQTSQFEMRKVFDKEMETSLTSFKSKIENIRNRINELAQSRFNQLDAIRQRLVASAGEVSKLRHKNMKQMMSTNEKPRISIQPEINELKERISKIEKQIAERGIQTSDKPHTRKFYSVNDDGSVSYITVTSDGTVLV